MFSLHQLKHRERFETKIRVAEEQENIYKKKMGYARDETVSLKKKYFKWLEENNMPGNIYHAN